MQVVHIKLIRKLLFGLILLVLGAVAFNYVQTFRRRARLVTQAAKILSTEMARSADSFERSEYDNGLPRFTLKAQRLLETRQGKSLLEGIEASDRNPDGSKRNQIRSKRADYDRDAQKAFFYDDVRILTSQGAEIRTNSLRYDLKANIGETEDKLELISRQVHGWARGVYYDHDRQQLTLKADVDLTLERSVRDREGKNQIETLRARSQRAYYAEDGRTIRWEGAARIDSDTATLSGERIEATFTEDKKRLTSLVCLGNALYRSKDPADSRALQGDRMDFGINHESGSLEWIDVNGHAAFETRSEGPGQVLRGTGIRVELDPDESVPKNIRAHGTVEFRDKRETEETVVFGEQLEAAFLPKSTLLENMRVWAGAHMTSRDTRDGGIEDLRADEIRMHFRNSGGRSAMQRLDAERSVKWTSTPGKKGEGKSSGSVRSLDAAKLLMLYSDLGDFLESGRADGNVLLSGMPATGSAQTEIRRMKADEVRFSFFPKGNKVKVIEGEGHVQVLYSRPADPTRGSQQEESTATSSNLKAVFRESDGAAETISQWGDFAFEDGVRKAASGRSDYSADKDLLVLRDSPRITDTNGTTTGEIISYDRKEKTLLVEKRVRSVLTPSGTSENTPFSSASGSTSPSVVTADEMKYWTDGGQIRYSGNVQMLSENSQLQARNLVVYDAGVRIEADGEVKHVLPRTAMAQGQKPSPQAAPKTGPAPKKDSSAGAPILIRSSHLRYLKAENSVHYTGNVTLESEDLWMASESLDAVFEEEGRRVERAAARGKVHIRQAGREVKGDSGDYYLAPGKFVVLGQLAEISDPEKGRSSARRLTFFSADDRILLENR